MIKLKVKIVLSSFDLSLIFVLFLLTDVVELLLGHANIELNQQVSQLEFRDLSNASNSLCYNLVLVVLGYICSMVLELHH